MLAACLPLRAQTAVTASDGEREAMVSGNLVPHPYVYLGASLMGGGYGPVAGRAEAGINVEGTQVLFRALGAYDNGRKTNDGDQPNPKGHDRYLEGALYFRPALASWWNGLFFGGGYRWSQLSTTNYTKGGSRYELGGGYDWARRVCDGCRRDFSMRVNLDWVAAGSDWQNGSHGPNVTVTMPSPREKRHLFWRESMGIYRFHDTITEPTNVPLTAEQRANKHTDSFLDCGVFYRF
jgi:hypothetical protein